MCLLFLFPFQLVKQLFYSYFLYLLFFPFHIPFSYFKIPPPFSSFFSFFFFKASGYLVTGWIVGRQWLPSLGETARPGMATDNKKERKRKNKKKKKTKKRIHPALLTLIHPSTLFGLFVSFACLVLPLFILRSHEDVCHFYIVASSRLFPRLIPHLTYYFTPFFHFMDGRWSFRCPFGVVSALSYLFTCPLLVCLLACLFVRRSFSGFLIYDFYSIIY